MINKTKITTIIGKTFADKLDETVIEVGDISYSRREMVDELGCANFVAAVRLGKVLKRLHIVTPYQLYRLDPASLARTRGIGEASIFVAMCILEAHKYDILKWWGTESSKFSAVKRTVIRRAQKNKQVA